MSNRTSLPTYGTSGTELWERLTHSGDAHRSASIHCWVGDRYQRSTWASVTHDAEAMTAGLRRAGVRPGVRVAAVLTNSPAAVRGLLAVWLAGGIVASLPVPARGMSAEEYAHQLAVIARQLEAELFLIDESMLGLLPGELRAGLPLRSWESLAGSGRADPAPPGTDEPAFIQYSSGSTSSPKGCVLTPRAIAAQIDIIATMIDLQPGRDVGITWLPLSHDMGLFGFLITCWWHRIDCYLSTPERFMVSPGTWFSDVAEFGGTLTVGNNTGLYLAARTAGRSPKLRANGLGAVRSCIVGAERIEWNTLRYAVDALGPFGFRESALMPAYGLAEATLAVTATPLAEPPSRLALDATALSDGELRDVEFDDPAGTVVMSAGVPCKEVEVTAGGGGRLAEITVRSPSLAEGYWGDEALTSARFRDGALSTGDLGFVRDGHLYPVGRTDDVISVAGRKVYAREIESAVDSMAAVRKGCSTLVVDHDGTRNRVVLFVELQSHRNGYRELAEQAASLAMDKCAVAIDECVILRRNALPKTPSGKIQRHRCRQLFREGRFDPLETVRLASG